MNHWNLPLKILASLCLVILASWAAARGATELLAALSWMSGLAWLAVAIDGGGLRAGLQATSGTLLLTLSWRIQEQPELGVLTALLAAAWILAPHPREIDRTWKSYRGVSHQADPVR
jgi:hypothetical protein